MQHKQAELIAYKAVETGELEIDSEGRVWRLKKRTYDRWTGGTKTTPCRRVRAEIGKAGNYLQVRVMFEGKRHYAAAHRLVWLHFKGPIPDGITINHEDGIKSHNHPDNLELATYSDQRIHAITKLGARHWDCRGEQHPKAILTEESARLALIRRQNGEQITIIAKSLGVRPNVISALCRGVTWKHIKRPATG